MVGFIQLSLAAAAVLGALDQLYERSDSDLAAREEASLAGVQADLYARKEDPWAQYRKKKSRSLARRGSHLGPPTRNPARPLIPGPPPPRKNRRSLAKRGGQRKSKVVGWF